MDNLISRLEIESILKELKIEKYFLEIDMKGAIVISLGPEYSSKIENIEELIDELDRRRTPDDIYSANEIFYPVSDILIEDDEDEERVGWLENKKFLEAKYYQKLNTWAKPLKSPLSDNQRAKRVAFYSYKGGVGRSTSLAIVARLLAKEGLKVAVIDLDLEAPGINSLLLTQPKIAPFGVIDYLYHAPWIRDNLDEKRFITQYVVKEDVPRKNEKSGQLIIMTAGGTEIDTTNKKQQDQLSLFINKEKAEIVLEANYLQKLRFIDFDLYLRQKNNMFDNMLEDIERFTGADIILMDARTGFSDVSGALLNHFSDIISLHVQDNKQNREGIKFICEHIEKSKLANAIWSHTKVPKNYSRESENLKGYISDNICIKTSRKREEFELNYHYLNYDSELENINANELQEYIDNDRISIAYKNFVDRLVALTGLDRKLDKYINGDERINILQGFKNLAEKFKPPVYISPRFLREDLDIFVGLPGSGRTIFKEYIYEKYGKCINIINLNELEEMRNSQYRILSNSIFLDWSFSEATQAVCKWLINSTEFFKWISKNSQISELATIKELERMRDEPEFELNEKLALEILNFVFNESGRSSLGWKRIFNILRYRKGYALPADIMEGVKLFLMFSTERDLRRFDKNKVQKSFFNTAYPIRVYKSYWRDIGERKKDWLKEYDMNAYEVVKSFIKIEEGSHHFDDEANDPINKTKELIMSEIGLDIITLDKILEKLITIEIFTIATILYDITNFKTGKRLTLSPVYKLISF